MDWDETLFNRFIFAIPELRFNDDFLEFGVRQGWIKPEELIVIKRATKGWKKLSGISSSMMKGQGIVGKLMAIMPEVMSVTTVDFLRKAGLLTTSQANALRVVFSGARLLKPVVVAESTIIDRLTAIYGAATSNYLVNFVRDLEDAQIASIRAGMIRARGGDPSKDRLKPGEAALVREAIIRSIKRAQVGRSVISTADVIAKTVAAAKAQDTVWGVATIIMENTIGSGDGAERLLRNAIRAGLISESRYELIRSIERLGANTWRKAGKSFEQDAWQARALIISEGILSPEMINTLREAGVISPALARLLYPAATSIRAITRKKLSEYIGSTNFRVIPGESPIATYARVTNRTDRQILSVLQEAARDAQKTAKAAAVKGGIGNLTRASQQRAIASSLHEKMRELWEHVGHLTIFGEKEAARAGVEGINFMNKTLFSSISRDADGTMRSLAAQARAGSGAFIGREENLVRLSQLVYNGQALSLGLVEREIQKALLRGVSADELANRVAGMIKPGTPGGVSYAAKRLARTEINNAFHFSQIQNTRDMPWVEAYKWNRSRSHGSLDACDAMASGDHDGIGRGVYKKKNVPGKPHPQCLCYLTMVSVSKGDFEKRLRSGAYDKYMDAVMKGSGTDYAKASGLRDASLDWVKEASKVGAQTAAAVAGAKLARAFADGYTQGRE
jgi:hypothetical protein